MAIEVKQTQQPFPGKGIPSNQGWLYLTTIVDLADRQILGWSFSEGMSGNETIIPAWKSRYSAMLTSGGVNLPL